MSENGSNQQFSYRDVFVNESDCDQKENLYAFFQGLLDEEQRKQFQQHLIDCDHCTDLLAELQDAETASESILDSKETEKIFKQTRRRIQQRLESKYGIRLGFLSWPKTLRLPAFANAMLLLLVLILIYPTYTSFVLKREVDQLKNELNLEKNRKESVAPVTISSVEPVVADSALYAVRLERDPGKKTIPLTFDREQKTIALVFSLPPEDFQTYFLEIAQVDKTLWQSEIRAIAEDTPQLISLQLHRAYFQEGEYLLTITGQKTNQKTKLGEYELIISK